VFPLTALPWPAMVQIPVNTTLKAANARFAAEVSSTLGHPAVVTGNLIEVGGGVVGVEDACSGLRALQAVVMLALFFGELLRLTAARRVVLFGVGVALALAANAARTIFLTLQMAWRGPEGVASWHDPAGVTELVLALVGVWLAVAWLKPRAAPRALLPKSAPPRETIRTPGWLGHGIAALLAAGFVGAQLWYGGRGAAPEVARLELRRPASGWADYALPEAARAMLQCSAAEGAVTTGPAREGTIALHLRWDRDPGVRYLAGLHAPEVCLPAVGATFERALPPQRLECAGRTIVLEARRFHDRHGPLHLFFGLWDAERGRSISVQENAAADFAAERWRLVRERRRSLALEQVTFAIAGCADDELAFGRLQRIAAQLVWLQAGPP
jgi:exosortase/archaeosortase family protein